MLRSLIFAHVHLYFFFFLARLCTTLGKLPGQLGDFAATGPRNYPSTPPSNPEDSPSTHPRQCPRSLARTCPRPSLGSLRLLAPLFPRIAAKTDSPDYFPAHGLIIRTPAADPSPGSLSSSKRFPSQVSLESPDIPAFLSSPHTFSPILLPACSPRINRIPLCWCFSSLCPGLPVNSSLRASKSGPYIFHCETHLHPFPQRHFLSICPPLKAEDDHVPDKLLLRPASGEKTPPFQPPGGLGSYQRPCK